MEKLNIGIDLGTNSLGVAIVNTDKDEICFSQSYIFNPGKDNISGGNREEAHNKTRRDKRLSRRQYAHKRWRTQQLLRLLVDHQMCPLTREEVEAWIKWDPEKKKSGKVFPSTPAFQEWLRLNPYELRERALREEISRQELGRIFYSIIKHRGFLSSRKGSDDGTLYVGKDVDKPDQIIGINNTQEALKSGDLTLGQFLYGMMPKEGDNYRELFSRIRARYTLRDMYVDEFDKIWTKQAPHLGLDKESHTVTEKRILRGSLESKENRKKLQALKNKHGEDLHLDITTDKEGHHQLIYTYTLPLKEKLGGSIERYDDGDLVFNSSRSVLFWQAPLRSQKQLIRKCSLESKRYFDPKKGRWFTSGPRVMPISHPLFEIYRAWKQILQIKLDGKPLSHSAQKILVEQLLRNHRPVKLSALIKPLGITGNWNYKLDDTFVSAPTIFTIIQLFYDSKEVKKLDVSKSILELLSLDQICEIWHHLYTYDDNRKLFSKLKESYPKIKLDAYEELSKIKLATDDGGVINTSDGYANLSLRAVRNILPFLQKGYQESDAIILGGVKRALGETFDALTEAEQRELEGQIMEIYHGKNKRGETISQIQGLLKEEYEISDSALTHLYHPTQEITVQQLREKLDPVPTLRNPLVEQALWMLRRVVNALIDRMKTIYGSDFRFNEIHLEMARELKSSKSGRARIAKEQEENKIENEEARQRILEFGLKPSRDNIQKYKLYTEIQKEHGIVICPYTGKSISISQLLGAGNEIQIEHIIPRAITDDDSFYNKTLCYSHFNRLKGDNTPWLFYQINNDPQLWGAHSWEEITDRARKLLPKAKFKKFITKKSIAELTEGMSAAQFTGTAYMTREALSYLSQISNNVIPLSGSVTAELRKMWGLNSILSTSTLIEKEMIPLSLEAGDRMPVYVVMNEREEPLRVIPKVVTPPERQAHDLMLGVSLDKEDRILYNRRPLSLQHPDNLRFSGNNKYRLHLPEVTLDQLYPLFNKEPDRQQSIVINTHINKGKIDSEYLQGIKTDTKDLKDGKYWIRLPLVEAPVFVAPNDKKAMKKPGKGELKVIGRINKEGLFWSQIYKAVVEEEPLRGEVVAYLKVDTSDIAFTKIKRDAPEISEGLCVEGTVREGLFIPKDDPNARFEAQDYEDGYYYGILQVGEQEIQIYPTEEPEPKTNKGESIIEGSVSLSRDGESIIFDPVKNRDDHRHHALDAIVIALASRSMVQKLSTHHANMDKYQKGMGDRPYFDAPWDGFREDVESIIGDILIYHKKQQKLLNKVFKKVRKNGQVYESLGLAVKGQLHKETQYGRRKLYGEPERYHHRVSINSIQSVKKLMQVVDRRIRELMIKHLQDQFGLTITETTSGSTALPANAFFDKGEYMIKLPNRRGGDPVPVTSVRIAEVSTTAMELKQDQNVYIEPGNNESILLYEDYEGEVREQVNTFWSVVDHRLKTQETSLPLPKDCKRVLHTLRKGDMFILNLSKAQIEQALEEENYRLLSEYLYKVQRISQTYYIFKKHTCATLTELLRFQSIKRFLCANPQKLSLSLTGEINLLYDDQEHTTHS